MAKNLGVGKNISGLETGALKHKALTLGFDSCGVCDAVAPPHFHAYRAWLNKGFHGTMAYLERQLPLKSDPTALLPGAQSAIVVALNYNQPNPHRRGYPRIARYALGRDYHKVIRPKLRRLATWIGENYGLSQFRICVDSAPILERDFANLAGLGWFGKNTMIIDSKRGNWFFIAVLLTTLRFVADVPALGSCGKCQKCVQACPTGAIVFEDERWQIDSRKCISYLTIEHRGEFPAELQGAIRGWTFGCDVCQEVCPFNRERESQPLRSSTTMEPDFRRARSWPSLQKLSVISQDEWDLLTRGSPLRRTGFPGLKRNAATNLENLGHR